MALGVYSSRFLVPSVMVICYLLFVFIFLFYEVFIMSMLSRSLSRSSSSPIVVRSTFSPRLSLPLSFPKVSPHTRQEFRDECDINTIMRRYISTGELPALNISAPQYLDVSEGYDFRAQMCHVAQAQTMFNELPSRIRSQFDNNPALFVDFCSNPANRTELAKMGLLSPEATREALSPVAPKAPTGASPASAPAASKPHSRIPPNDGQLEFPDA